MRTQGPDILELTFVGLEDYQDVVPREEGRAKPSSLAPDLENKHQLVQGRQGRHKGDTFFLARNVQKFSRSLLYLDIRNCLER